MKAVFTLLIAVSAMAAANSSLQFVPSSTDRAMAIAAKGLLPLAGGSVAVFGSEIAPGCPFPYLAPGTCSQLQAPLLSILTAAGNQTVSLALTALGSGNSTIVGAAVDTSANIWITGETDSDDFPLTHALYTQKAAYQATGFVAKLDLNLNILFSSFLSGQNQSTPAAIALDSGGNPYITGTADTTFPQTGAIFGPTATAYVNYVFITKLASDGSKTIYSRLLGGNQGGCSGAGCNGPLTSAPSAIAVDAAGNTTVAGQTDNSNFPVTANVYSSDGRAFISRISADGSTLVWSTTVGMTPTLIPPALERSSIQAIALDSASNVYVAGSSYAPIAATSGALQSTYQFAEISSPSGFLLKLSSDATQLLFATNLAGSLGSTLAGVALDSASNIWVTGFTASPDFPGVHPTTNAGLDFALEINANATGIQQAFPLVPQTLSQPPVFDTNGNLLLLAAAGNLLRLNATTAYTAPAAFALTNAAVPSAVGSIGEEEIMTLYGTSLGPQTGIVAAPDSSGAYPTTLGGVTIQIGGISAPLLYVGPNQINFEVPASLKFPSTMAVVAPSGPLPAMTINVDASIGIFGVVNSDGTVNTSTNPAKRGSIVSLYLTGLGLAESNTEVGVISPSADSEFMNSVEVTWAGASAPLPLFYAGTAPGLIDGVSQINVQLPAVMQNPTLTVTVPGVYTTTLPPTSTPLLIYTH